MAGQGAGPRRLRQRPRGIRPQRPSGRAQLPGWKLVQGRSTRKWTDQDAAFQRMERSGIDEALLYTRTPISLTVAEKMIGKKKFAELMSAFITKAPGAPKLATASDPRPEYNALEASRPRRTSMNTNEVSSPAAFPTPTSGSPSRSTAPATPSTAAACLSRKATRRPSPSSRPPSRPSKRTPGHWPAGAAQCPRT